MPGLIITILVAALATTGVILYIIVKIRLRNKRRNVLRHRTPPSTWQKLLEKNVPVIRSLPKPLSVQLFGLMHIFLDEKNFVGCEGQDITEEVRVTIAAQACMLLLNRPTRFYPKLKTIYVYPHAYVAKTVQTDGTMVIEGQSVRLGESWTNGPLVLSWDSVTGGARNLRDGQNVVYHEFAHQLDQEDGSADGAPILDNRSCYRTWAEVLGTEYEALCHQKKKRKRSVLNKYGATNPAEFFAVATEAFFEKPKQLHKRSPDLYQELKGYYQVDPLSFR